MGSLLTITVIATAALYAGSEWRLGRTYERPTIALNPPEPPSAERGERLSILHGCQGCHGTHGRVFADVPALGLLVAPDLARKAASYTDAELAVLIRAASSATAPALSSWRPMRCPRSPIKTIAWVCALKAEAQTETASTTFAPLGRFLILTGGLPISTDMPRDPAPPVARPTLSRHAVGKYLVTTACAIVTRSTKSAN